MGFRRGEPGTAHSTPLELICLEGEPGRPLPAMDLLPPIDCGRSLLNVHVLLRLGTGYSCPSVRLQETTWKQKVLQKNHFPADRIRNAAGLTFHPWAQV